MGKTNHILWAIVLVFFACSSCNKDENIVSPSRPDTYIIGINLGVETPLTKGVSGGAFNQVYEETEIYLHKKTNYPAESESIKIPVYTYTCQNPENPGECKGFRYKVTVHDNGNYTLTAINQDDTEEEFMTVSESDKFYFSSIKDRQWKVNYDGLTEDHIQEDFEVPNGITTEKNELYTRDPNVNKEIYRSEQEVFTLEEILSLNGDLEMKRTCSGYSFMALFTTREQTGIDDDGNPKYELDSELFERTMGDSYRNWYIKIYMGNIFTNTYDMQSETGQQSAGGFYGSTDRNKYAQQGLDDGFYLPFRSEIKPGSTIAEEQPYEGMGYQSTTGNVLIAPTDENKSDDFTAFILIKHWTDPNSLPSDEWLQSNEGAIYTQVTFQGVLTTNIQDGIFYECGINIDINELKAAAEQAGILTAPTTKSMATHDNKPKKFTLHNAETFVNY